MPTRSDQQQIIYGRNPIIDAISEGKKFERIYVRDTLTGELEKEIRKVCKNHQIPLKKVPLIKLDKLSRYRNHQGVLGIGSIIDYQEIGQVIPHLFERGIAPVLMLLDNVQDTRNIGAISRSVEVLGGHGLILSGKQTGMITHDSIKTSVGALTRLMVLKEKNTIHTIQTLQSYGIRCIGLSTSGAKSLYEVHPVAPVCFVLGSEDTGLHQSVEQACDELASIPQIGQTESLNVSVVAGIVLYELGRLNLSQKP